MGGQWPGVEERARSKRGLLSTDSANREPGRWGPDAASCHGNTRLFRLLHLPTSLTGARIDSHIHHLSRGVCRWVFLDRGRNGGWRGNSVGCELISDRSGCGGDPCWPSALPPVRLLAWVWFNRLTSLSSPSSRSFAAGAPFNNQKLILHLPLPSFLDAFSWVMANLSPSLHPSLPV